MHHLLVMEYSIWVQAKVNGACNCLLKFFMCCLTEIDRYGMHMLAVYTCGLSYGQCFFVSNRESMIALKMERYGSFADAHVYTNAFGASCKCH